MVVVNDDDDDGDTVVVDVGWWSISGQTLEVEVSSEHVVIG